MSNFTHSELNEIKDIVKSQLQAKSSKEELRPKSKREIYFKQFNKIADVELRERCKELYDDDFSSRTPNHICNAIESMCNWEKTEEKKEFWLKIYKRTDLETNPYIISRWKPEVGDTFYYPDITGEGKCYMSLWRDSHFHRLLERGLVFRTPEEAISCTNKMLEAIKK